MRKTFSSNSIKCPLCGGPVTITFQDDEERNALGVSLECNDCGLYLYGGGDHEDSEMIFNNLNDQWNAREFDSDIRGMVLGFIREQRDLLVYLSDLTPEDFNKLKGPKERNIKIIDEIKGIVSISKLWRNLAFINLLIIGFLLFKLLS